MWCYERTSGGALDKRDRSDISHLMSSFVEQMFTHSIQPSPKLEGFKRPEPFVSIVHVQKLSCQGIEFLSNPSSSFDVELQQLFSKFSRFAMQSKCIIHSLRRVILSKECNLTHHSSHPTFFSFQVVEPVCAGNESGKGSC